MTNASTTAPKTAVREARRQRVLELTIEGRTTVEIAQLLAVNQSTISRDLSAVKDRLKAENDELAESYRDICVRRLQQLYQQLLPDIALGDVRAINAGNSITMNLAKLTGALAAEKVEVSGPQGGPISLDVDPILQALKQRAGM